MSELLVRKAKEFAEPYYDASPHSEALKRHVELVRRFAVELAEKEGADRKVVEIAAVLHDVGLPDGREKHHLRGRELTKEFLKDVEMEEKKKEMVLECVLKHRTRFCGGQDPLEVKVLQSADILGTLFNERWQEKSRKELSRNELMALYDKAERKLVLESAREIAEPRLRELRELALK